MVLLVDDDPTTNFLHRRTIAQVASETCVVEAANGREALDLLRELIASGHEPPQYIFLDINMPELDGWGFLSGYSELPPDLRSQTRVFVLTTSLNPDDHMRAKSYGDVVGVVDKILTRDKLRGILQVHGPLAGPMAA